MKNFFEYKYKFVYGWFLSLFSKKESLDHFIFVTHPETKGWILGAIARRLSKHFNGKSEVYYTSSFKKLPIAEGYCFHHQDYFAKALRYNPHLRKSKAIVMFTHSRWTKFYSKSHISDVLKHAHKVVCLNNSAKEELIDIGVKSDKILIYHLASNPDTFPPKEKRDGNTVGFCCFYSERKNPDLIHDLVLKMPEREFILVGQNWENYPKMNTLLAAPNFTYYDNIDYSEYPSLYAKMDVFVSPSYLEGGPVPLLESMLTNLIPVSSSTGFCVDIIEHGKNGFLFDAHSDDVETVVELINKAFLLTANVREHVLEHSWENYGNKLYEVHTENSATTPKTKKIAEAVA